MLAIAALLLVAGLALVPLAGATAPTVSITGGPAGTVASASASFSFNVSDDTGTATVECSLDGGGFAGCSSGVGYSGLSDGAHTFTVQVTNVDGTAFRNAMTPVLREFSKQYGADNIKRIQDVR